MEDHSRPSTLRPPATGKIPTSPTPFRAFCSKKHVIRIIVTNTLFFGPTIEIPADRIC